MHKCIGIHVSLFSVSYWFNPPQAIWLKKNLFLEQKKKQFHQFIQIALILSFAKVVQCLIYGHEHSNVSLVWLRTSHQQQENIEFEVGRHGMRKLLIFTSSSVYSAEIFIHHINKFVTSSCSFFQHLILKSVLRNCHSGLITVHWHMTQCVQVCAGSGL